MDKNVTNYINKQKAPLKKICNRLRNIIFKTYPKIKEEMKYGVPWYEDRYYFFALKDHVNLGFAIKGLTRNQRKEFEGKGMIMRHIAFEKAEDYPEKEIVRRLKMIKANSVKCCHGKKKR